METPRVHGVVAQTADSGQVLVADIHVGAGEQFNDGCTRPAENDIRQCRPVGSHHKFRTLKKPDLFRDAPLPRIHAGEATSDQGLPDRFLVYDAAASGFSGQKQFSFLSDSGRCWRHGAQETDGFRIGNSRITRRGRDPELCKLQRGMFFQRDATVDRNPQKLQGLFLERSGESVDHKTQAGLGTPDA